MFMNIVVDGLMTNYQKVGSGKKTIVCLHGWADTSKSFAKLLEQLQDKYTFYVPDLPGFGGSQAPDHAWGTQEYADFLNQWASKLGLKKIDAVIGHSFGGSLAIAAAPEMKIDRIVLIASAGIRGKRSIKKTLLKTGAKAAKFPLRILPAHKRRVLKRRVYQAIGSDSMLLPHMELAYRRILKEDIRKAAAKFQGKALLIYGSKDTDTPPVDGAILSRALVGSKLEIIDGAGHFVHQEDAPRIARMIEAVIDA